MRQGAAVRAVAGTVVAVLGVVSGTAGVHAAGSPFTTVSIALPGSPSGYDDGTCPSPQVCILIGYAHGEAFAVRTSDGGATWSVQTFPEATSLNAISCPTATVCYAGGQGPGSGIAFMLRSNDGGSTWVGEQVPSGSIINSIGCGSASDCIAGGSYYSNSSNTYVNSEIRTTDGSTWATVTPPGIVSSIRCVDVGHCWMSGSEAWRSGDVGASWQQIDPPQPTTQCPTSGICIGDVLYSELNDIEFQNDSDGYVVGGDECGGPAVTQCSGALFFTTDGGAAWMPWPGSQQQPIGWQIQCRGGRCLYVTDAANDAVVLRGTDTSWTLVQRLPGQLGTLACTPQASLCLIAGRVGSTAVLYSSRSSAGGLLGLGLTASSSGNGGGTGGANPAQSTLATAPATPASLTKAPLTTLLNALLVLALVVFITFPAHLFNRTYDENHVVIQSWFARRLPMLQRLRAADERVSRPVRRGVAFAAVLVIAGVLGALLDPRFGANARTGAVILGIVIALGFVMLVGAVASALYRRAQHQGLRWHLHALPSALLVGGACVLVSRLLNFQPGYLYGVIGGVAFSGVLDRRRQGHETAIVSAATLTAAVLAWLIWVPVSSAASQPGAGFGWALLQDMLAAVFVSGIVGLTIGLVPLRFLPGERLAAWHRGAWALVFGLSVFALLEIMLRPQSAGAHVDGAPFWTTLALFIAFGAASVAFWGYFRVRRAPSPAPPSAAHV